jgi:hypothetical protein
MDNDIYIFTEICHGFIHAVIDDLIGQVVKPNAACIADIHGRALPNCLKTFEHLYTVCRIFHSLLAKRGIYPHFAEIPQTKTHLTLKASKSK